MIQTDSLNPKQSFFYFFTFIAFILLVPAYFLFENNFIISSIGIFFVLFLIWKKTGFFSAAFLLSFFLFYPSFSPLIANVLLKADYYSMNNMFLQDDLALTNKACLLLFLAVSVYYLVISRYLDQNKTRATLLQSNAIVIHKNFALLFGVLFLAFCWLAEPGTSIISVNYTTMVDQRYEGVQFASAFVVIFWVFGYINYKSLDNTVMKKCFEIITVLGCMWLFLHARRNELLGIVLILTLHFANKGWKMRVLSGGAIALLALIFVGEVRSNPMESYTLNELFELINMVKSHTSQDITNTYFQLIGGASNIFVTFLDSIYLIDGMKMDYLYGETYGNILYNMIPTNLIVYLNLPSPKYFYHLIEQYFQYNGGTYVFSPAYVNFGVPGVLVMAAIWGRIVAFASNNFVSDKPYLQGVSLIVIATFSQGVWYGLLPFLKPILFTVLFFFLIGMKWKDLVTVPSASVDA